MKRGFYTIIAAQFFSSLADNALLIAAIALLAEQHAPPWMTPVLKLFFVLSYVVLAAFVGAFADAFPKGRVMFGTNLIKVVGCVAMLAGVPPLISYGIVGLGAAAYSPAKYGILTELLPPDRLVVANGWMEGTTVLSIVLGTVCGGILISPHIVQQIMHRAMPFTGHAPRAAILIITAIYLIAAAFNLRIPDTGVRYPPQQHGPIRLVQDFANCFTALDRSPLPSRRSCGAPPRPCNSSCCNGLSIPWGFRYRKRRSCRRSSRLALRLERSPPQRKSRCGGL
jgi:LPLT family lysophospholipid transporter-like MFS transporter